MTTLDAHDSVPRQTTDTRFTADDTAKVIDCNVRNVLRLPCRAGSVSDSFDVHLHSAGSSRQRECKFGD